MLTETCEPLSDPHGRVRYEPDTNTPVIRTVAIYTCNEGYILNGSTARVCEGKQGWTGFSSCKLKNAYTFILYTIKAGSQYDVNATLWGASPTNAYTFDTGVELILYSCIKLAYRHCIIF